MKNILTELKQNSFQGGGHISLQHQNQQRPYGTFKMCPFCWVSCFVDRSPLLQMLLHVSPKGATRLLLSQASLSHWWNMSPYPEITAHSVNTSKGIFQGGKRQTFLYHTETHSASTHCHSLQPTPPAQLWWEALLSDAKCERDTHVRWQRRSHWSELWPGYCCHGDGLPHRHSQDGDICLALFMAPKEEHPFVTLQITE